MFNTEFKYHIYSKHKIVQTIKFTTKEKQRRVLPNSNYCSTLLKFHI